MGLFDLENSTNGLIQFHYLSSHMGKIIVKGTMVTKVGVLTKDYILQFIIYIYIYIYLHENLVYSQMYNFFNHDDKI